MLSLILFASAISATPILSAPSVADLLAGNDLAMPLVGSEADTLARKFLESLSSNERAEANPPFSDAYRTSWAFVPLQRRGATLGKLNDDQRSKATKLLRTCLSESGYRKIEDIRHLETVLFELENKNPTRDLGAYVFVVFGEPSPTGAWGWRYEGHHLSLNFTYSDDRLVSSSPQFLGSNPAEVRQGPSKGKRVLAQEEELAFALLDSLSDAQRAKAVTSTVAPADIITGNQRKAAVQSAAGVPWAELDSRQRKLLMDLVRVHASVQTPDEQKRRMGRVESPTVVFAWMGSSKRGAGHYYRIQGSTFLIEYDNTQNNANHVHTAWRDFDGDFGGDVLEEHYRHGHGHRHRRQ